MCSNGNPRINVLIIDDNNSHAESLSELICDQHIYKCHTATNCEEALDLFCPNKFSMAFIDLMIDGSIDNGIDLIAKIRKQYDNIFLVVVSAYPDSIYNKVLIECVDDFIKKPIDNDFFQSKLFLWSTKYERRRKIVTTIESKCSEFACRMQDYETKINYIKKIELEIEELASRISMYHPPGEIWRSQT